MPRVRDESVAAFETRIDAAVEGRLIFSLSETIALRASLVCKNGIRKGLRGKLKSLTEGGASKAIEEFAIVGVPGLDNTRGMFVVDGIAVF